MRPSVRTLVAAAALMMPAAAFAGGYAIPNTNARDLGMAEAAVAAQQGPEAVYGNSAALAGQEGFAVTAGVQGIYFRSKWTDTTGAFGGGSTNTVDKLALPPEAYAAYGGKVNGMPYGLGAGFTLPGGGFVFWPSNWPGRSSIISVDRKVYNVIVAGGIQPIEQLKIGLGGVYFRTTEKLQQGLNFGTSQGDIQVATSGGVFSWTASLEAKPIKDAPFTIGMTYRHQAVQNLTGDAHAGHVPPAFQAAGLVDQGISHSLTFPNILQVGVATTAVPDLLIAAAYQISRFTVYQQDAFIGDKGVTVNVAREFHNQQVFRLGAEYGGLLPGLKVRAGVLRDVSPQPTDTLDPSLPDSSSWATNLGASYGFTKGISATIGWEHAFFDQTTTTGANPFPGQYNTKADLVGVSVSYRME
jgi:long-chain fatty acid transport protein